ncbi:MAG: hydrogenase maturation nickel metallochaperone HypA, partial [Chloroflexi bacterium]|nr:hydrogenase maturation nickel metallochaperone HypA [Chloroflexota bacterium]
MRERDAVQSILQKAIQQASEKKAKGITSLQLAVGELVDYTSESIKSHLEELGRGTIAEGAKLKIRIVQAEVQCMACFTKY